MRIPYDEVSRNGTAVDPELAELRTRLHRMRVQLSLVEVLYLRLIGLQARRAADPRLEIELTSEVLGLERELQAAQTELERLGCSLSWRDFLGPALPRS